jgi:hypothetical protein
LLDLGQRVHRASPGVSASGSSAHIALRLHPQTQRQREDHGAENPRDHPIFEGERQPQQDQRHPERPDQRAADLHAPDIVTIEPHKCSPL